MGLRIQGGWVAVLGFLVSVWTTGSYANDAEVVMLVGKGDSRETAQSDWQAAFLQQKLKAGAYVRTREASQMALLLRDRTQVRLNQQSALQIKGVAAGAEGTTLELSKGRVWAQAKQAFSSFFRTTPIRVRTPTATIGIRGTDWDVQVGDTGTTTVTVLSGLVDITNDLGRVEVGPNEQALIEPGKAPVKSLLSDAKDRVQWVTAYRPAPRRWVPVVPESLAGVVRAIEDGDYMSALKGLDNSPRNTLESSLVRADMQLFLGQANEAIALLTQLSQGGAGNSMAVALHARALVIAGRMDEARQLLVTGIAHHSGDREIALALGDLARLDGDSNEALRHFGAVAAAYPTAHEAWFGIGRVESEKENVGTARRALDAAIKLAPSTPGYYGERATVEALAGSNAAAKTAFDEALKRQPDDYLALTGLGILQLKTGETDAALESFLKAGVIEPRFARAQLYVGVTYYQLGNRKRALESIHKAAELDAKDPLPYVMLGLIHGDAQELADSVDAARNAQERMPFLKSLNQVLNNQKGSANVGSSLAARGMEEWARNYAVDSYNPYWGGSALFLADRYADGFNKNSELYKGFLLDPTAFGASNRFSSLVATPGHYGSVGYLGMRGDFNEDGVQLSANGLSTEYFPVAYSLVMEGAGGEAAPDTFQADGGRYAIGLGARPIRELGLFYFGTGTEVNGHYNDPEILPDDELIQKVARHDLGIGFRIGANNHLMLKLGVGEQSTRLSGEVFVAPFAGMLDRYDVDVEQSDYQFQHTVDFAPGFRVMWGAEHGEERRDLDWSMTFFGLPIPSLAHTDASSTTGYLSSRVKPFDTVELQADVFHQRINIGDTVDSPLFASGEFSNRIKETNHRLGIRFSPAGGQQFRAVYQRWRKPVGPGTLGPVDTLGIPVEDRLVDIGGQLRRTRAQYDAQIGSSGFVQVFWDRKRIKNIDRDANELFTFFPVSELDSLRSRKPVFALPFDDLEDSAAFGEGVINSGGIAGNWLLTRTLSVVARYTHASSDSSGRLLDGTLYAGNRVPFVPSHVGNIAAFWQVSGRWLVGANATYRTKRFTNEANESSLAAGWIYGLMSYWETENKCFSVEVGAKNLNAEKEPGKETSAEREPLYELNLFYRF